MIVKAQQLLKNIFGYDSFRPLQREVIEHVLSRKDTLVIMPTGGGKSLCYQIPALIFEGLTVVVSPLISLMKDQVDEMQAVGINAVLLNSSITREEYNRNILKVKRGEAKMLYVAPETLLMDATLDLIRSVKLDCLTIDEAHCISEWGHDFRPEYRQLVRVRQQFPGAVCMALTATATPRVQKDIKESLHFRDSDEFIGSFNRENLFLEIAPKTDAFDQVCDFLESRKDESGIIYCFSRKQVDDLCLDLAHEGHSVKPYHAGLSDQERKTNQELFIRDDVRIMVATIAFGMGINKPNVRFVVHHDLPKNIESYYQQIGRAGRDGLKSHCLLLFSYGDRQKIDFFIRQMEGREAQVARLHLNELIRFAESDVCRRLPLLSYFGETLKVSDCGMCDNCTENREQLDMTIPAQKFLSCVMRSEQRFGANHIIDILRGGNTEKVRKFHHQKLSTYGIGLELSKKEWMHLSRQMLGKGLMLQDAVHGNLKVTEKGMRVLMENESLMILAPTKPVEARRPELADEKYDHVLYDMLRKKRKALADKENLPPYIVFSDKTLVQMAARYPRSREEMLAVHGVGGMKMEKYGLIFQQMISEYCQAHNIPRIPVKKKKERKRRPSEKQKRHQFVGEAFNSGRSIPELMYEFKVKVGTILNHLEKYQREGNALRIEGLLDLIELSDDQQALVMEVFERKGIFSLGPVYSALGHQVSYEELRLMRLIRENK